MKKNLIIILLSFFLKPAFSQDYAKLNEIEIKTAEQCRSLDSKALECANFILSTPSNNDINRLYASAFVIKWMTSTADYNFSLDTWNKKLSNKKDYLLGVYMAALTKFSMENKETATDKNAVAIGAYEIFAEYCSKEGNVSDASKELKKMLEAYSAGKLKEYLKM